MLLLLLLPLCGWAQDDDAGSSNFTNELGVNAGFTTGLGLSYRHWGDRLGFQITGVPTISSSKTFISGAITGLYSIKNYSMVRVFAYWGNHVIHESYRATWDESRSVIEEKTQYNTGVGLGFSFGRIVAFNVQIGYAAYDVFSDEGQLSLLPTIEVGLYWCF